MRKRNPLLRGTGGAPGDPLHPASHAAFVHGLCFGERHLSCLSSELTDRATLDRLLVP